MFRKLHGFMIINPLFVYAMKLITIQIQLLQQKFSFTMLKPKFKENGEHGLNMLKKVI
jgi:hypothetical protein